jgi:hypothetical protein
MQNQVLWHPSKGTIGFSSEQDKFASVKVMSEANFLDLVEIPFVQGIQGVSLMPIIRGEKKHVQDITLVELQATKNIYQQTMITDRYKLVVYRDQDYGELYDMQNDPDQYKNLWDLPELAEVKAELMYRYVKFNMKKEGYVHERKTFA